MELIIKTYIEPFDTPEKLAEYKKNRNHSAYYATASNFAYNIRNKTFYEAITARDYRCVRHELCLKYNGFYYDDIEPEYIIRLSFSSSGFYDGRGNFGGVYTSNDLGIVGLKLSGVYIETRGFDRINNLKAYDLNLIESYIELIMKEQADIRNEETDYRLVSDKHVIRSRNRFNNYKK